MILLIDGPEKAGKTTLIAELYSLLSAAKYAVDVTKHGPFDPDDTVISALVKKHSQDYTIHIWDRGWPSEEVYASLLNRTRRAYNNPFLMEWLHGRATIYKFILLPTQIEMCKKFRDSSDLPVNIEAEINRFHRYKYYGYTILYNNYTQYSIETNISIILAKLNVSHIPYVYGNTQAKIWFVVNKSRVTEDRWMPLSYESAKRDFFTVLGPKAFEFAFMFAREGNPSLLSNKIVTTIGTEAADWVHFYVPPSVYLKLYRLKRYESEVFKQHIQQMGEYIYERPITTI